MAHNASPQSLVERKFHMGQGFLIDDLKHLVDGPPECLVLLPSAQGLRHRVHIANQLPVVGGYDGVTDTAQRGEEIGLGGV